MLVSSQSLANIKTPTEGFKGILVNGGQLTNDYLLIYTITTTDALYSGANLSINGIRVAELTSLKVNCPCKIVGSIRAFKGDKIAHAVNSAGGTISVYAYR